MLSKIKSLLDRDAPQSAQPAAAPAAEYIFLLDPERKKEYLLDLRAILRTPGARDTLPKLHRLELIFTRNDQRVRIPHDAMPSLVRELMSVERRIPETSPLREILNAVPGLAESMRVDPTPTSVLMGERAAPPVGGETVPPPAPAASAEPAAPAKPAAAAKPPPAAAAPVSAPAPVSKPEPAPTESSFGNTIISTADQQRFLQDSKDAIKSTELSADDGMADTDLASYFDLCFMSRDYEKIIDELLPRIAEKPTIWAWVRLLSAAEAAKKLEFEVWCSNFKAWVGRAHPSLLPNVASDRTEELRFGVRRVGLHELERKELAR